VGVWILSSTESIFWQLPPEKNCFLMRFALSICFQPALQFLFTSLSCINSAACIVLGPNTVERRAGLQAVAQRDQISLHDVYIGSTFVRKGRWADEIQKYDKTQTPSGPCDHNIPVVPLLAALLSAVSAQSSVRL
jgi:hypothetical protein